MISNPAFCSIKARRVYDERQLQPSCWVGFELRVSSLWALLSALALILYVLGVYPPESEQPVNTGETP